MYSHSFLVTSVRGSVDLPQIAANASLSFFGAKMPLPAFFMLIASLLLAAFLDALPAARFSAVVFFNSAFVIVVFFVVVVVGATVVFVVVVVVIARGRM